MAARYTLTEGSAVSIAPGPFTGLLYPSEITRIPGTLRQLKLIAREMESQSQDILYISEGNSVSRMGLHLYLDDEELIEKVKYVVSNPVKRWPDVGEYRWVGARL